MSEAILTALKALDVNNDNHWTADGLARLDTVKMLASDQNITRESVDTAAPGFNRASAATYAPPSSAEGGQGTGSGIDANGQPTQQPAQGTELAALGGSTAPLADGAAAAPRPAAGSEHLSLQADGTVVQPGNENGETKLPEVEAGSTVTDDEIASLEAELAQQVEEVSRLRTIRDNSVTKFNEARTKEDEIRIRLDSRRPKDDDVNAIQSYLASQRDKLQERGARQQLIKDSGVNLKELADNLRSPLDAAMSRKTARGGSRPKH